MLLLLSLIAFLCVTILAAVLFFGMRYASRDRAGGLMTRMDLLSTEIQRLEISQAALASSQRQESAVQAAALRDEVARRLESHHGLQTARLDDVRRDLQQQVDTMRSLVEGRLRDASETAEIRLTRLRSELNEAATLTRSEMQQQISGFQGAVKESLAQMNTQQAERLSDFSQRLKDVNVTLTEQLDKVRLTLDQRLAELQTQNAAKLDEMRQTVDQKLQATLEQRLGESFKIVSESLERVTRGLGEMQQIAAGVGDLKRVLTNVKTRGTWSEVQLAALLEQMLTREQFAANVAPNPASDERVEFALRLPGQEQPDKPVWLPIDAKFPVEDYQRLMEAAERGDHEGVVEASAALEARIRHSAREIATKYLAPPHTTDFGILYLPTEGLYAEAVRRSGLVDTLQREHRIVVAGPTTLAALLNSLQMGFRTLAIQKRSSEVWTVLGAVKTEFGKFAEVLSRVKKKLDEASTHLDQTGVRSRAIERRLRNVESLPEDQVVRVLPGWEKEEPEEKGE
ncbi:MAG TPA: DNA recombination protein RmuC [Opitutaceae bacterium]|nr:DNA recombination protein RmuC [Opitutaceae bacterium]